MTKKDEVGSLFSGIGGIEIGFEKAGFETKWFVEREPYAQEILRKRFPKAKIYDDITKIDFREVPGVEILTGGFPCQDISNAGKRAGIEGSRSSLWKYYLEAISTLRPRIALIENVSALLGRGLDVVLCDLTSIGYDAEWYCVPASAVGANHQRDRVFIIAYPNRDGEQNVSNTEYERQQRKRKLPIRQELFCKGEHIWATEPNVGRVANGVPFRVDRIKCLGNAVVPQVAEIFAKAIKEEKRYTFNKV